MNVKEKGCVYFFRHIGLTPVKIGYSTNESPISRFNQFKTYAPYGSEILGFIQTDDAKELESKLHLKYSQKRLNGEWFEITEQEVIMEVDFYSNIEDVKDRNDFQIAWAYELNKKKFKVNTEVSEIDDKKAYCINEYAKNPNINKTKLARELKVSRRAIYYWLENR